MKVRIQKLLANHGIESRRHVEEMVLAGRVKINGKVPSQLPVMVNPQTDTIELDDEVIYDPRKHAPSEEVSDRVYILMNKPPGVYCTNVSQGEQTRAIDLLPPEFQKRVYPVGRLDADSRGLLLLTNDGELTNLLTHPRFGVTKIYRAVVDGSPEGETLERLQQGVWLGDRRSGEGFKTARSRIKIVTRNRDKSVLEITISEGRNRQVRRMFATLGHKVRHLTRIKMGPLEIGSLKPGESRPLRAAEVKSLYRACEESKVKATEQLKQREEKKKARSALQKAARLKPKIASGRRRQDEIPMRKQSAHPLGKRQSIDDMDEV
jgi:23S rRNA pseudouridine2605 synthase